MTKFCFFARRNDYCGAQRSRSWATGADVGVQPHFRSEVTSRGSVAYLLADACGSVSGFGGGRSGLDVLAHGYVEA
jgi:hypothetical protein